MCASILCKWVRTRRPCVTPDLVTDLVGHLDNLELHEVVVAAYDLGAVVTWSLSAIHPSSATRICAIDIYDLALDQICGYDYSSVSPMA